MSPGLSLFDAATSTELLNRLKGIEGLCSANMAATGCGSAPDRDSFTLLIQLIKLILRS